MKKKFLSIIMAICLLTTLISVFSVSASAAEPSYVYVDFAKCRAGSTVDIPVRISTNWNGNIACLIFSPEYDHSIMTLKSITCNIEGGTFLYNENEETPKFVWYDVQNHSFESNSEASYIVMTFEVNADAPDGTYTIALNYNPNDICNENGETVALQVEAGQLTTFHYLLGDVNDDLSVNGADLVLLARYLVNLETEISTFGADVNSDGMVDGRDLVKLARHMACIEFIPGVEMTPEM